jgi:hypothetical protein
LVVSRRHQPSTIQFYTRDEIATPNEASDLDVPRHQRPSRLLKLHFVRIEISADKSQAFRQLEILSTKAIETHPEPTSMRSVLGLAQQFGLTAYDAAYLDIAIDLQVGLDQ